MTWEQLGQLVVEDIVAGALIYPALRTGDCSGAILLIGVRLADSAAKCIGEFLREQLTSEPGRTLIRRIIDGSDIKP